MAIGLQIKPKSPGASGRGDDGDARSEKEAEVGRSRLLSILIEVRSCQKATATRRGGSRQAGSRAGRAVGGRRGRSEQDGGNRSISIDLQVSARHQVVGRWEKDRRIHATIKTRESVDIN